jgi:hypothetical protein
MTEPEIFANLLDAIQAVLTVFSLFFAIVSGYVVALYLFLARAPLVLRATAFGLLSVGLVFLGGTAAVIGRLQEGLFAAWGKLEAPLVPLPDLRNPLPVPALELAGVSQQELGVGIGWSVALAVYLVLAYLTFLYRWPNAGERWSERHDQPR